MAINIFSNRNMHLLSFLIYFSGMYLGLSFSVQAIALFVLIQIILLFRQGVKPISQINKLLLLPIGCYLIHLLSYLYSGNEAEAGFDLQVKFSFFILPIIFSLVKQEHRIEISKLMQLYGWTSLLFGVGYILKGALMSEAVFPRYILFSHPMHPSYLALYFATNIAFIIIAVYHHRKLNIIQILSLAVSLIMLYLAESKAGIISVFVLFIFLLFKLLYERKKILSLSIVVISVMVFAGFFILNPRFKGFLLAASNYREIFEHPEKVQESTALRLLAWNASWEIIKHNPILGVGAGDIDDELCNIYRNKNYKKPLEMRMNSHNQFLETTVGQGIIGLLFLLFSLSALLIYPKNRLLNQSFFLLIVINLLFESMFNTQAGVVFIVFIYCVLLSAQDKGEKANPLK